MRKLIALALIIVIASCSEEKRDFKTVVKSNVLNSYLGYIQKFPESTLNSELINKLFDYQLLTRISKYQKETKDCISIHKQALDSMYLSGKTRFIITHTFDQQNADLYCSTFLLENFEDNFDFTSNEKNIILAISAIGFLKYSSELARVKKELIEPTLQTGLFIEETKKDIEIINSFINRYHKKAKTLLIKVKMNSTLESWSKNGSINFNDFNFKEILYNE